MVAPQITALPTPPARNDPANFATRGDAFLLSLPQFQAEANAVSTFVDFRIQQAFDAGLEGVAANALSALNSKNSAAADALSAFNSANTAAALLDQFDDRNLGAKSANPSLDNDGNALQVGSTYFNTAALETRVWNGSAWQSASVNGGTVNSLTVTGAFEYQGTFTGGAGVMNIGGGQLVKDGAGNLGLGVVPSAWQAGIPAFDIGGSTALVNFGDQTRLYNNSYTDAAGVNRYKGNGFANLLINAGGAYNFSSAPSGTAGAEVMFTTGMELTQGGNLRTLGTISSTKGTTVASATTVTLGDGNFFDITGTTTISNITIKPSGTVVYLKFNGSVALQTGAVGNSGAMRLSGGASIGASSDDVLTLISDGINWWQTAYNNN